MLLAQGLASDGSNMEEQHSLHCEALSLRYTFCFASVHRNVTGSAKVRTYNIDRSTRLPTSATCQH